MQELASAAGATDFNVRTGSLTSFRTLLRLFRPAYAKLTLSIAVDKAAQPQSEPFQSTLQARTLVRGGRSTAISCRKITTYSPVNAINITKKTFIQPSIFWIQM